MKLVAIDIGNSSINIGFFYRERSGYPEDKDHSFASFFRLCRDD